jgi:hypothetical protein
MKKLLVPAIIALALVTTLAPGTAVASEVGEVADGLGAYAAVGCGLFSRAIGSGMVSVGTIAGAIATCAYMFIDALFFDR